MKKLLIFLLITMSSVAMAWQPIHPITAYMPWKPGSYNEQLFRKLSEIVSANNPGTSFVVTHKPGENGVIAGNYLLSQPADGYSLVVPTTWTEFLSNDIYEVTNRKYKWNTFITPVVLGESTYVLVAKSDGPVKTFEDATLSLKNGRKNINVAMSTATIQLVYNSLVDHYQFNTNYVQGIPYAVGPEIILSVLGNQTQFGVLGLPHALPHVQSGQLRILAVSSKNFNKKITTAPAMFSDLDIHLSVHMSLHPDTPKEIVDWYQQEFWRAMQTKEYNDYATSLGVQVNKKLIGDKNVKQYGESIRNKFRTLIKTE